MVVAATGRRLIILFLSLARDAWPCGKFGNDQVLSIPAGRDAMTTATKQS